MKYFYSVIISALIFLTFSCAGVPKLSKRIPGSKMIYPDGLIISSASVINDEAMEEEEIEEEVIEEDVIEQEPEEDVWEDYDLEDFVLEDNFQDITNELIEEVFEITEDLFEQYEEEEVETVELIVETPQPVPSVSEQPLEQSPMQPPVQQPIQPPEQPPIQQSAQPPVQQPEQPPVQPPFLLAPAEERLPPTVSEISPVRETPPPAVRETSPSMQQEIVPPVSEREPFTPFVEPERTPVQPQREPSASQSIVTPREDDVVFSRVVRATVGQMIEIPFTGNGWVYLGELASRRGIVYNSRRLDQDGQTFIFRADEAGTYALKFYKQDFIRDYILNDHVQVIVGEAPAAGAGWFTPPDDRGRVVAEPRWPTAEQEAEILRGGSRDSVDSTAAIEPARDIPQRTVSPAQDTAPQRTVNPAQIPVQDTDSSQGSVPVTPPVAVSEPLREDATASERQILPPDVLLQRAKESFDAGNVAAAIALLDQYREHYPSGTDELYWMYGQFYEANSPSRNILLSLDYYRRLVDEYPQSSRYNDARRRISYLERFYINIQ